MLLDTIKPNMLLPSLGMSKTDPNEITNNKNTRADKKIGMLSFSYITKVNILCVGNYMISFISNNMQLILNQILRCKSNDISIKGIIHIYFHKI